VPFCIYTIIGAGLWNTILAVAGIKLKQNWEELMHYSHTIDIGVLVALVALVGLYIYKHRAKLRTWGR
jgi:membrane protein DedA with SNARE-associated domain